MSKKWLLSAAFAISISMLAACGGDEGEEGNGGEENAQEETEQGEGQGEGQGQEQAEMPEPDIDSVPDVVAEVNGESITKEEFTTTYESQFQRAAMQSQMTGQEVDQDQLKQQVAEGMVGTELLIQEAGDRGFEASEEDVNQLVDELVEQNGMESQDDLFAAFEEQGMSEDEIMSQIETQVKIDQLIAEEAGDVEPTEEELQEAYDQTTAQQEQMGVEDIPSFEEMKADLTEQVKMQKENEAAQTLIEQLREDADVTVHV
ncbi:SurA N-terminal domain-containing protein [Alteribacillus persepolensis]|uniref:peptidylprolyl isomerase n=1 Tax=Alteribacillus persepolensis TaxID=568899 RepID=A0A1G8H228_9BACI|nr:SurA N-terminal domain-containing protein [Alteribacillus persepolensis]